MQTAGVGELERSRQHVNRLLLEFREGSTVAFALPQRSCGRIAALGVGGTGSTHTALREVGGGKIREGGGAVFCGRLALCCHDFGAGESRGTCTSPEAPP